MGTGRDPSQRGRPLVSETAFDCVSPSHQVAVNQQTWGTAKSLLYLGFKAPTLPIAKELHDVMICENSSCTLCGELHGKADLS